MEEKEEETAGNCCASCGSPLPSGMVKCPKCSQTKIAKRRPVRRSHEESSEHVSVLRTPEESVRKSVAYGTLTKDQAELLLLLLSKGRLLDFSVRSVLMSLVKEIAEARDAQKREGRVYTLMEFLGAVMPSENFAREVRSAFRLQ